MLILAVTADLLDSNPDDLVLPSTLQQTQNHVNPDELWPDKHHSAPKVGLRPATSPGQCLHSSCCMLKTLVLELQIYVSWCSTSGDSLWGLVCHAHLSNANSILRKIWCL